MNFITQSLYLQLSLIYTLYTHINLKKHKTTMAFYILSTACNSTLMKFNICTSSRHKM